MRVLRLCGLFTAIISSIIVGHEAFAQQSQALVRRSAAVTANVTDVDVLRQQRVEISTPHALRDADQSQVLELDLFLDVSFRALRQRLEPTAYGISWTGVLEGYPESSAVFVLVDDELIAHLYTPIGFFRIHRDDEGNYVVQQVRVSGQIRPDDAVPVPEGGAVTTLEAVIRPLADSGSQIDVMVVYTRGALAGYGTETRARAAIDLMVAETNRAFRNSNISTSLRLVYSGAVDYNESGDSSVDLGRLQASTDGFLDDLHSTRDRYAADLVSLITERMEVDVIGRAYVNRINSSASAGFSIVKRSATNDGETFAHELGHNLGAHHDWYVTQDPGAFTYSKGYVSLGGRFLDLMAYWNQCVETRTDCSQLLAYSNPRLRQSGYATGVASGTSLSCRPGDRNQLQCDADNALTLNSMAAVIARFRDSQTSITVRQILPGASKRSDNNRYRLLYQNDGNLVLYDDSVGAALWASNTAGSRAGQAVMQEDGNFVIYDALGAARWATNTAGNSNAYLLVQNDGNLVIYRSDGQPVWDRFQ